MPRVVAISNRVLTSIEATQAGGAAVAIFDSLRETGGLWFGWSGTLNENRLATPHVTTIDSVDIATVPLSSEEHLAYYLGYANSVLWPVFHNRLDLARFEAGYHDIYAAVSRSWAAKLKPLLRASDVIWVHDYHLLPMARALKALGVSNKIGFFLHIPFPSAQTFLAIPEHDELAADLSAYDLVGLQTMTDVAHLLEYLRHRADGRVLSNMRIRTKDREFAIGSFTVGIDVDYFVQHSQASRMSAILKKTAEIRAIGVDRLDYTKGLPQKFQAFGRFLEQHPEYRQRAVLTQIAAPSRQSVEAYADIKRSLQGISGAINGKLSELDWTPIRYMNRTLARERLIGLYRASRLALVTPLRDGMNLVAKEYVASQDPTNPGVLVLSQFAGCAEKMRDAIIVNPYDVQQLADAIHMAIEMPLAERCERHAALLRSVYNENARNWARTFLNSLSQAGLPNDRTNPHSHRIAHVVQALQTSSVAQRRPNPVTEK
jgi:trehalose 6-phosphate synthase